MKYTYPKDFINCVINEDCLNVMPFITAKSIDLILCDLSYGLTENPWDNIIPFELLWKEYERVIKDNGAIILFSSQPFTTDLINSNRKLFKYEIIWEKIATGFLWAKRRPMKSHENILVFYKKQPTYNYQNFTTKINKRIKRPTNNKGGRNFGVIPHGEDYIRTDVDYPISIIRVSNPNVGLQHPTEKPIALCKALIRLYSNENDVVLDNCFGYGSTAIACKKLNRNFIGIEISKEYCDVANQRLRNTKLSKPITDWIKFE